MAAGDTANAVFYYKQAALSSLDQHAQLGAYHYGMAIAYNLQKKYDSAYFINALAETFYNVQTDTARLFAL